LPPAAHFLGRQVARVTVDYDFGDPRRIDRILQLVSDGWRCYPAFRLGQFLEIVCETHELGVITDYELERRLKRPIDVARTHQVRAIG
jgi:hypothetical protein